MRYLIQDARHDGPSDARCPFGRRHHRAPAGRARENEPASVVRIRRFKWATLTFFVWGPRPRAMDAGVAVSIAAPPAKLPIDLCPGLERREAIVRQQPDRVRVSPEQKFRTKFIAPGKPECSKSRSATHSASSVNGTYRERFRNGPAACTLLLSAPRRRRGCSWRYKQKSNGHYGQS